MKKLLLGLFAFGASALVWGAGEVTVINEVAPKNGAFQTIVRSTYVYVSTPTLGPNFTAADYNLQHAMETISNFSLGGGGGGSPLAVGTGTASNFTAKVTTNTASLSFLGSQFSSLASGTTNFISLNQSSVTLQGILLAGSNITLTPGSGSLTIASTGGSPGGSNKQMQYNNAGSFGGLSYTSATTTGLQITAPTSSDVPLRIKGAASQSGDMTNWILATGETATAIDSTGVVHIGIDGKAREVIRIGNIFGGNRFLHTTDGTGNSGSVFLGIDSGNLTTTGQSNTVIGSAAAPFITSGSNNTGVGKNSLFLLTSGSDNFGLGTAALAGVTTGNGNVGIGSGAMPSGNANYRVAIGNNALSAGGADNSVAIGYQAGVNSVSASNATLIGSQAGYSLTSGANETAIGENSLRSNSVGVANTAVGEACAYGATGSYLTVMGYQAGNILSNSADGLTSIGVFSGNGNTGNYNTFLGYNAYPSLGSVTNAMALGQNASVGASNTNVIGAPTTDTVVGADSGYSAKMSINTNTTTKKGIVIKSVSSQTANLIELQDSSAVVLSSISANGGAYFPTVTVATITINKNLIANGSSGTSGQVLQSNGPGVAPTWATVSGGGGGSSTLAVGTGTASNFTTNVTSPTAALSFLGTQFRSVANGTTNFISIDPSILGGMTSGSTMYIQNTNSLQSGATFYVSSGTVAGSLTTNGLQDFGSLSVDNPSGGTGPFSSRSSLSFDPTLGRPSLNISAYQAISPDTRISFYDYNGFNYAYFSMPMGTSTGYSLRISSNSTNAPSLRWAISAAAADQDFYDHTGKTQFTITNHTNSAGTLRLYDSAGFNYVGLASSGTIGSNLTFVLPNSDGTAGQVLQTDGSKNLSWATVSGGGGVTPGSTNYIQNKNSLQSGATFYVSSGTVQNTLSVSTINLNSGFLLNGSAGTSGQFIKSGGPGGLPTWSDISGTFTGDTIFIGTVTVQGVIYSTGSAPTISSCGSVGASVLSGTNNAGRVISGSSPTTTCSIDWPKNFKTTPSCTANMEGVFAQAVGVSPSATGLIMTVASNVTGATFNYVCIGLPN